MYKKKRVKACNECTQNLYPKYKIGHFSHCFMAFLTKER